MLKPVNQTELKSVDYKTIIDRLFQEASYFEIVDQPDELDDFLKPLGSCLLSIRWANKWAGTKTSKKAKIMAFRCDELSQAFFSKFDDFITEDQGAYYAFGTDYQFNSIFYINLGSETEPVLYITVHEGFVHFKPSLFDVEFGH